MPRYIRRKLIHYFIAAALTITTVCSPQKDDDDDDTSPSDDDVTADDDSGDDDSGDDDSGDEHVSSAADWIEIHSNSSHTCGLHSTGSVECWGSPFWSQTSPPPLQFLTTASTCGIVEDGSIICWSENAPVPPSGSFIQISTDWNNYCAIDSLGQISCWDEYSAIPPQGQFVSLDIYCAIGMDGAITCWEESGETWSQPGSFTFVAAGGFVCGIGSGGFAECWGYWPFNEGDPPSEPVSFVDIKGNSICWVKDDGSLDFRSLDDVGYGNPPSGEFFSQVSIGNGFVCGIRTDGHVQCWGEAFGNKYGQTNPP